MAATGVFTAEGGAAASSPWLGLGLGLGLGLALALSLPLTLTLALTPITKVEPIEVEHGRHHGRALAARTRPLVITPSRILRPRRRRREKAARAEEAFALAAAWLGLGLG